MAARNLSLFESDRLTLKRAIDLTAENLTIHGSQYCHWVINYSGGKDSTTVATLIPHLIEEGRIPKPESLTVKLPREIELSIEIFLRQLESLSREQILEQLGALYQHWRAYKYLADSLLKQNFVSGEVATAVELKEKLNSVRQQRDELRLKLAELSVEHDRVVSSLGACAQRLLETESALVDRAETIASLERQLEDLRGRLSCARSLVQSFSPVGETEGLS